VLLRISARQSDLARLQAKLVGQALKERWPESLIQYQFRESLGDKNLQDPLWKMPEKGVFTEDFYKDLIEESTDLVVHSWKDLPTESKPDTVIAGTLPRADQRDLLLMKPQFRHKKKINILSSSPRRAYNLVQFLSEVLPTPYPAEIEFQNVRGNIPTRVRKLVEDENFDGLILAKAALDRLLFDYEDPEFQEFQEVRGVLKDRLGGLDFMVLPSSVNPNAAAQGAIAIEVKVGRADILKLIQKIHHAETLDLVQRERQTLSGYGGGCHQKIGVACLAHKYGVLHFEKGLTTSGQVLSKAQLLSSRKPPRFPAQALWVSGKVSQSREQRREISLTPADQMKIKSSSLWISRPEALPSDFKPRSEKQMLWAAGTQTWKALARRGLWVSGSADSLGEWQNTKKQIQVLSQVFGKTQEWLKLTHSGGLVPGENAVATYELQGEASFEAPAQDAQFFFWKSGSQFKRALKDHPFLRERYHAAGPGLTLEALLEELNPDRVFAFYDENDWRTQCQTSSI
jgi:hydroxymethylbilane synthase